MSSDANWYKWHRIDSEMWLTVRIGQVPCGSGLLLANSLLMIIHLWQWVFTSLWCVVSSGEHLYCTITGPDLAAVSSSYQFKVTGIASFSDHFDFGYLALSAIFDKPESVRSVLSWARNAYVEPWQINSVCERHLIEFLLHNYCHCCICCHKDLPSLFFCHTAILTIIVIIAIILVITYIIILLLFSSSLLSFCIVIIIIIIIFLIIFIIMVVKWLSGK